MRNTRSRLLSYLKTPLLGSLTIFLIDCVGLLIASGVVSKSLLVLLLFLEGGAGLLAGAGVSLSATPSISRVGHMLFGTASWSRDSEKHAERVGCKWMLASSFLIAVGVGLSIL